MSPAPTESPSLAYEALFAALFTTDRNTGVGLFVCVNDAGKYRVLNHERRAFVCPECRSALVPQVIVHDEAAVRRYVAAVFSEGKAVST